MIHRIHNHHESKVRETYGAELLNSEVLSYLLQILHILDDSYLLSILDHIGTAPVSHIVKDERPTLGKLPEVLKHNKSKWNDDHIWSIADLFVKKTDPVICGYVSLLYLLLVNG